MSRFYLQGYCVDNELKAELEKHGRQENGRRGHPFAAVGAYVSKIENESVLLHDHVCETADDDTRKLVVHRVASLRRFRFAA